CRDPPSPHARTEAARAASTHPPRRATRGDGGPPRAACSTRRPTRDIPRPHVAGRRFATAGAPRIQPAETAPWIDLRVSLPWLLWGVCKIPRGETPIIDRRGPRYHGIAWESPMGARPPTKASLPGRLHEDRQGILPVVGKPPQAGVNPFRF